MKKILLALVLMTSVSFVSRAQNSKQAPKTDNVDPVQYSEKLSRALQIAVNLNEDQYRQVFDINMRTFNEIREAKNSERAAERIASIRAAKNDELKRILTTEQFSKMLEWNKTRKEEAAIEYKDRMIEKQAQKAKSNAKPTK